MLSGSEHTIKIFDTHCDTVFELHKHSLRFDNERTHLSLKQTEKYELYEQIFALWSSNRMTPEENWQHFLKTSQYYENEIVPYKSGRFIPHLAVEGGALLDGRLDRVDVLKQKNVRLMTLVWQDNCCIGGAHNTNRGLSPFGKDVLAKMLELDIVPDVSHASDKMIFETLDRCLNDHKPVIASHSNSRKIRQHTRNLTDEMFDGIKRSGGLVGISFCCYHLEDTDVKSANITSIIRHIEHYMSLGGQKTVCLGCDFDGIEELPDGILGAKSLDLLYNELHKLGYTKELLEDIFYNNAHIFFENN